jgi:hypothetical protein
VSLAILRPSLFRPAHTVMGLAGAATKSTCIVVVVSVVSIKERERNLLELQNFGFFIQYSHKGGGNCSMVIKFHGFLRLASIEIK